MHQKDYLLQQIEQAIKAVSTMLGLSLEKEYEEFEQQFNTYIPVFFNLELSELEKILQTSTYDKILLHPKSIHLHYAMFIKKSYLRYKKEDKESAKICLSIAEKILNSKQMSVSLFPTQKEKELQKYIDFLYKNLLKR